MSREGVDLRLALCGGGVLADVGLGQPPPPALLVSYAYWDRYAPQMPALCYRDYALDSGGFTLQRQDVPIDRAAYAEFCLERLAADPRLTEVFTLDSVPGDWRTTLDNTEYFWARGLPAIPIYHYGEPWDYLDHLRAAFPGKLGIGGAVYVRGRRKLVQALAIAKHIWPARLHGLGFGSADALLAIPWDSVDHTNWLRAPAQYATWRGHSGAGSGWRHLSVRQSGALNVRNEIDYYLALERKARFVWRHHHAQMQAACAPWPPPREEPACLSGVASR